MASKEDNLLSTPQGNVFKSEIQPGRNKVALKPGHSLMDWIRLTHSDQDLTGVGGKIINVTAEELAKHNKRDDAWISLKGKVYNVTAYMDFHPGGEDELMRGVGKDATDLFNEVHRWVNADSMLQKCLVGRLKVPAIFLHKGVFGVGKELIPTAVSTKKINRLNQIDQKLKPEVIPVQLPKPNYEWFQSDNSVSIIICTNQNLISKEDVIVDLNNQELFISIWNKTHTYHIHLDLEDSVQQHYEVKTSEESNIIEILLLKTIKKLQWKNLGVPLKDNNTFLLIKERDVHYRSCILTSKDPITHNTYLFTFALPDTTSMLVPIGYHVHICAVINDVEMVRSYTPVLPALDIPKDHPSLTDSNKLYLMIKIYPDGTLTSFLNQIEVGDTVNISNYDGNFDKRKLSKCKKLALLAAGTGFTPMVKLLHYVLSDSNSERLVKLLLFNREEKDIMWREQLDRLSESNNRFQVKYILSEPHSEWTGHSGHVKKLLLETYLPSYDEDILICICGPTIFTKICLQFLEELEYNSSCIHAFLG